MSMINPIILFDHVSKRFVLHRERAHSFQDLVVNTLHRRATVREDFWALRDVSLTVERGEMLGLIGPNGAGKSTILKLMTRILQPTSGKINVQGRVAALLELGTGFHPDLTGRENVFLNGSLLGFSRRQMAERLDSIIEFAGMERFIDMPVRHYSSGMYMRLGFAIAIHSDPDILITDEVLAVGDEAFQHKCLDRMSQFRDQGVTIILVSHALPMVRKLCDRVVWLRQGSIVMDGTPDAVVDSYIADVAGVEKHTIPDIAPLAGRHSVAAVQGLADMRLLGVEMIGPDDQPRWSMTAGEQMNLRVSYQVRQDVPQAAITLQIHDADDQTVICGWNSYTEQGPLSLPEGTGHVVLRNLAWPLRQGRYLLSVALFGKPDPPAWANSDDLHHKAYQFTVHSTLHTPQRRWGSGEALVETVRLCGDDGKEISEITTGESLRLYIRCSNTNGPVYDPVVRVQIFSADGVLCHATNTERVGLRLGCLDRPKEVMLTYHHLDLLEGEYVLSVGLWPDEYAERPYDWHEGAYRLCVHSEYKHGGGLLALGHQWTCHD